MMDEPTTKQIAEALCALKTAQLPPFFDRLRKKEMP